MRPVNLIPADQRRGQNAPMRTGPLPYLLVGALVVLLAGVALLVSANNEISEKKSEIATLESEDQAAEAQAQRLAAYVQFEAVHKQRLETIAGLADSRFDWERVMRELALVLPGNVWLSEINASAGAGAGVEGGGGSGLGGGVVGPSLSITGCATGQEGVAGFVTALEDIDGVTRVGVEESSLPSQGEGTVSASGEEGGAGACQTRDFIAAFNMTVAFDAAPAPVAGEGEVPGTVTEGTEETAASTEGSEAEAEGTSGE
ncbi:MAG TPA: PilN domain-containing protein [Solirubrobacterales bacterium]|nr:PilN domain-containing protein [Solirubrobacterales bacterium]